MKAELKKMLLGLKESDFGGTATDPALKAKAEKFLNSDAYKYNESYMKVDIYGEIGTYDVHGSLLCLIYDEV